MRFSRFNMGLEPVTVVASLVMLQQTVKVEVYVREVMQVVSNVLILTNKEPRQVCI